MLILVEDILLSLYLLLTSHLVRFRLQSNRFQICIQVRGLDFESDYEGISGNVVRTGKLQASVAMLTAMYRRIQARLVIFIEKIINKILPILLKNGVYVSCETPLWLLLLESHCRSLKRGSRDYERESSKSRSKDRERGRDKDKDKDKDKDREIDKDKYREKSRDRDRERERDKDRDRHRDRYRERSERRERGRYRDDDDYHRSRDYDRRRDYDRDRDDRRSRHRSRFRSRAKSEHRSRSRSRSRSKSKRVSSFDMAPPASAILDGAAAVTAVWKVCTKMHGVILVSKFSSFKELQCHHSPNPSQLLKEGDNSMVDILKLAVILPFYIPLQEHL
ncbi:hypothetical protein L2E82_18543 [Cichorium intybus]|uniref:Uncharacterized protein n=1 Tax=Cichorium intybus TaxID=13427 RepID=A0ACB9FAW6_CICIN|nr:hypothetical protein L2E82_18543 [Cichorium intybus]